MLGEKLEGGRRIDTETGLIMPWYTSPCLEWLLTLDLKGKFIFEYGVGDSTFWFHSKKAKLRGVDSNQFWAELTQSEHCVIKNEYIMATPVGRMFDIIIIDGLYRDECTEFALKKLKPGGYLIIDNFHQASADLEHWPLTDKLIEGMPITIYKEPGHQDWCTAVITNNT